MSVPPGVDDEGNGHMLSFNHYAYGAVVDWIYRNVAGIAPSHESPGYRHTVIAPKPATAIQWSEARLVSAYGPHRVAWRLEDAGVLRIEVELPFGTYGTLEAPITEASEIRLDGIVTGQHARVDAGHHVIEVTAPRVAGAAGSSTAAGRPA
jgi:alpha-L-rhamnosidase